MERVLFGSLSEFIYEISPVQRQCTQNMSYKASQMRRYRVARYLVRKCGRIDTVLSNVSSIQRPIYSLSFIMQEEKLVKQRACHVGIRAWFQSVVCGNENVETFGTNRGYVLAGETSHFHDVVPRRTSLQGNETPEATNKLRSCFCSGWNCILQFSWDENTVAVTGITSGNFLIGKSTLVESVGKET